MTTLADSDPIRDIVHELESRDYIADPAIATSIYMAQALGRPLLIEGRAGVREDGDRQCHGAAHGHAPDPASVL